MADNKIIKHDLQRFRIGRDKWATVILQSTKDDEFEKSDLDRLMENLKLVQSSFVEPTQTANQLTKQPVEGEEMRNANL